MIPNAFPRMYGIIHLQRGNANPFKCVRHYWHFSCQLQIGTYQEHCPEKAMAPHSSTLAWKNPMDGGAWKAAVHGVAEGQARLSDFTFTFHFSCIGEGNENPLQCSCLANPGDVGAWWATISGVAQSQKQLKWLSSSSKSIANDWTARGLQSAYTEIEPHAAIAVNLQQSLSAFRVEWGTLCSRESGGTGL